MEQKYKAYLCELDMAIFKGRVTRNYTLYNKYIPGT